MKVLKRTVTVILTVAMLALTLTASGVSAAAGTKTVSGKFNYDYSSQVLALVNSERAKAGLSALAMDDTLVDGANLRAAECTVSFSHTRPNGTSCFTAFEWQSMVGENIAYGQRTPEQVMNGWMNSQGHRENILKQGYTKIGVGCFVAENGTLYWAQEFSGGKVTKTYNRSGSESATVEVALTSNAETKVSTSKTPSKTTEATEPSTQKVTKETQPSTQKVTEATEPSTQKATKAAQPSSKKQTTVKKSTKKTSKITVKKTTAVKKCSKKSKVITYCGSNCNSSIGNLLSQYCPSGNCGTGNVAGLLSSNCSDGNCNYSLSDLLSQNCSNGSCDTSNIAGLLSNNCSNGSCNSSLGNLLSQYCPNGSCDTDADCGDASCKAGTSCSDGSCNTTVKGTAKTETKKATVKKPSAPALNSVASCKKCFTAKWSKVKTATSYKLCYAADKSFSKEKVCKNVSSAKTSLKVSGLKSGKKYFVRIQACNSAGCSSWSAVKSVKVS